MTCPLQPWSSSASLAQANSCSWEPCMTWEPWVTCLLGLEPCMRTWESWMTCPQHARPWSSSNACTLAVDECNHYSSNGDLWFNEQFILHSLYS